MYVAMKPKSAELLTVSLVRSSRTIQDISNKWKAQANDRKANDQHPKIPLKTKKARRNFDQVVMSTILQTAAGGPENAHFFVNSKRMRDINHTTATDSILSDLTQAEILRSSFLSRISTSNPTMSNNQKVRSAVDCRDSRDQDVSISSPSIRSKSCQREQSVSYFDPLLGNPSPCTPLGKIASFDSLEWGCHGSNKLSESTFRTAADPWKSLLHQTFHMGRNRTSIDHDGFPMAIHT